MVRIGKCPKCKDEMQAEGMHIANTPRMIVCSCGYEQEAKYHQIIGNVHKGYMNPEKSKDV